MAKRGAVSIVRGVYHQFKVLIGAVLLTLGFFLILPMMSYFSSPPEVQQEVSRIGHVEEAPKPPAPEELPEPEEVKDDARPPEMVEPVEESQQNLSLDQLMTVLGPPGGGVGGGFRVPLIDPKTDKEGGDQEVFRMDDLDQKPRILFQPAPQISEAMRQKMQKTPGKVHVIFMVDANGRVENPIVKESSDPVFDRAATAAVKQWRFDPGKRGGKPVRFRMSIPISFRSQ